MTAFDDEKNVRVITMKSLKKIISLCISFVKSYLKYEFCSDKLCIDNNKNSVILIGTPEYGNLGDHLIAFAEIKLLEDTFGKDNIIEITENDIRYNFKYIKSKISEQSFLFLQGGGNISDVWVDQENIRKKLFDTFTECKMLVFPQTAYIIEDSNEAKIFGKYKDNVIICAREKFTYELLNKYGKKVMLCPDITFYLWDFCKRYRDSIHTRDKIGICIRKDAESIIDDKNKEYIYNLAEKRGCGVENFTTVKDTSVDKKHRQYELEKILTQIGSYKLVITDRLHAMIMAYLVGTPCLAFANSNRKIEGCYEWISNADNIYFAKDIQEGLGHIEDLIGKENTNTFQYIDYYKNIIDNYKEYRQWK